jgi:hypothetical protein
MRRTARSVVGHYFEVENSGFGVLERRLEKRMERRPVVCSGVKFRKIRSVVKRNEGVQHYSHVSIF